jgi:hypothetical protein
MKPNVWMFACGVVTVILLALVDTHSGVVTKYASVALFGSTKHRGIRDITVGRSYGDR